MRKRAKISPEFKKQLWERLEIVYEQRYGKERKRNWGWGRWAVAGVVAVMMLMVGRGIADKRTSYQLGEKLNQVGKEMNMVEEMQSWQEDNFESDLLALESL